MIEAQVPSELLKYQVIGLELMAVVFVERENGCWATD